MASALVCSTLPTTAWSTHSGLTPVFWKAPRAAIAPSSSADTSFSTPTTGEPIAPAAFLAGHAAFYWGKLDEWYVEDEQVFGHPRDPYHRIDTYLTEGTDQQALIMQMLERALRDSTATTYTYSLDSTNYSVAWITNVFYQLGQHDEFPQR